MSATHPAEWEWSRLLTHLDTEHGWAEDQQDDDYEASLAQVYAAPEGTVNY